MMFGQDVPHEPTMPTAVYSLLPFLLLAFGRRRVCRRRVPRSTSLV